MGAAIPLGAPLPFSGGLALGYLLAAVPIASWAWVAPRLLQGKSKALAVVLLFLKMGFYAAALYVGVYKHLVNPIGVLVGMTGVGTVIVLGLLLRSPSPAKEAA